MNLTFPGIAKTPAQSLLCHAFHMSGSHLIHQSTTGNSIRLRRLSYAMTLVAASGTLGLFVFNAMGWVCPLRSAGLACPSCGCGRAVNLLLGDGISAVIESQPTAGFLLLVIAGVFVISLLVRFLPISTSGETVTLRMSVVALGTAGLANFLFQLGDAP